MRLVRGSRYLRLQCEASPASWCWWTRQHGSWFQLILVLFDRRILFGPWVRIYFFGKRFTSQGALGTGYLLPSPELLWDGWGPRWRVGQWLLGSARYWNIIPLPPVFAMFDECFLSPSEPKGSYGDTSTVAVSTATGIRKPQRQNLGTMQLLTCGDHQRWTTNINHLSVLRCITYITIIAMAMIIVHRP